MNLFQYERFFKKHFDLEVRSRGMFLIDLISQLEMELLMHSWASTPTIQGGNSRLDDLNLRAILYAINRHGGNKVESAKWLGLAKQTVYDALKKWNTTKTKIVYEKMPPNLIADCTGPVDSLSNKQNDATSGK